MVYQKYQNQKTYGETESDREEGRKMYAQSKPELKKVRIKLSKFKRIYEMIESGQNITLTGIDKLYEELFDGDMNDDYLVSKEEINKFKGWENKETGEYYNFGE